MLSVRRRRGGWGISAAALNGSGVTCGGAQVYHVTSGGSCSHQLQIRFAQKDIALKYFFFNCKLVFVNSYFQPGCLKIFFFSLNIRFFILRIKSEGYTACFERRSVFTYWHF